MHLSFNIIGTIVWLTAFETANLLLHFSFVDQPIDTFQIAVIHSIFNVLCTLMLLPCCGLLEKLSYRIIPIPPPCWTSVCSPRRPSRSSRARS